MNNTRTKAYTLGYIKKRVLTSLGEVFEFSEGNIYNGSRRSVLELSLPDAVYSSLVEIYKSFRADTCLDAPFIDESTSDDFEIELDQLSLEALICLCAGKLCSEEDGETYTRLMYRYKDLCHGTSAAVFDKNSRNSFYKAAIRGVNK